MQQIRRKTARTAWVDARICRMRLFGRSYHAARCRLSKNLPRISWASCPSIRRAHAACGTKATADARPRQARDRRKSTLIARARSRPRMSCSQASLILSACCRPRFRSLDPLGAGGRHHDLFLPGSMPRLHGVLRRPALAIKIDVRPEPLLGQGRDRLLRPRMDPRPKRAAPTVYPCTTAAVDVCRHGRLDSKLVCVFDVLTRVFLIGLRLSATDRGGLHGDQTISGSMLRLHSSCGQRSIHGSTSDQVSPAGARLLPLTCPFPPRALGRRRG